jgi:hypothetical protein
MAKPTTSPEVKPKRRVYEIERDEATGCWRTVIYEVDPDALTLVHRDEPRYLPNAVQFLGKDVYKRLS